MNKTVKFILALFKSRKVVSEILSRHVLPNCASQIVDRLSSSVNQRYKTGLLKTILNSVFLSVEMLQQTFRYSIYKKRLMSVIVK